MATSSSNCCICQKAAAQLKETAPLLRTVVGTPPVLLENLLDQCIGSHKAKRICKDASIACICKCCQSKLLEYYEATLYVHKKRKEFKRRVQPPYKKPVALIYSMNEAKAMLSYPQPPPPPQFLELKPKMEQIVGEGDVSQEDPLDKDRQDESVNDLEWCNAGDWHEEEVDEFIVFPQTFASPAIPTVVAQQPLSESKDEPPPHPEDNESLAIIKLKIQEERSNRYCRECEVECPSEEVYRLHVKKFHPTEFSTKANFVCAQCGMQLASDETYRQHMVEVHQRNGTEFGCDKCGRSFNTHTQLIAHAASHTAHTCTICGKTLSHRRGLLRHMETHSTEKKHQCAECGNKYPTTSSLKKHMMIHSDTRNHQCPTCGNRFRSASHLKRHQNTHTSSTGTAKKS